ncbi:hypothetical protein P43SY_001829 [Pythium insidiosum]|uniref:Uncharacterized protein n=1 Tax=Pythium insidiosum TaxID=114742 RepID=A0AAD5LKM5_PYTIN|nr:hypothetical protein P43SY_001829 [Pythium insidiosum]
MDFNAARYAPNADGTAMHLCAQFGFLDIAEVLVDFGLELNARNKLGQTPLHIACKFAQIPFVQWLLRQHVRLDIPDQQCRVAFDVAASFEVLDTCVLAPLRQELAAHESVNADRELELETARSELDASQLALRRAAMTLTDLESQLEEERQRVLAASARERVWRERERRLLAEVDDMNAEFDVEKARWLQENDMLQTEFDAQMRPAQLRNDELVTTRDGMTQLVAKTDAAIRAHEYQLCHQLGVVDAALVSYRDNRDVHLWSWSLLAAMLERAEQDERELSTDLVHSDMLVLFDHATIQGVLRTLAAFPMDVELVTTLLEVMVRLFRVFVKITDRDDKALQDAMEPFASQARDGSAFSALGDVLIRWHDESATSRVLNLALEALFFVLKCSCVAHQRVFRICQSREIHVLSLRVLSEVGASENLVVNQPWLASHASLLLFTLVKYGVKTPLIKHDVLGLVMQLAQRLLSATDASSIALNAVVEALEHAFAALALLLAHQKTGDETSNASKSKRAARLNDFPDADTLDVDLILRSMQFATAEVGNCRRQATNCIYWSIRVLHHASKDIGPHALRIRLALLSSPAVLTVVLNAFVAGSERHVVTDCVRVVDAGVDLLQAVWLERFDDEGRMLPTEASVLLSLVEAAVRAAKHLPRNEAVSALHLSDLGRVWHPLAAASANAANVKLLSELVLKNDGDGGLVNAISDALRWVVRYVDEASARYKEPLLVMLLRSASEEREASVATPPPRDWRALAALCHRLRVLLDCKC